MVEGMLDADATKKVEDPMSVVEPRPNLAVTATTLVPLHGEPCDASAVVSSPIVLELVVFEDQMPTRNGDVVSKSYAPFATTRPAVTPFLRTYKWRSWPPSNGAKATGPTPMHLGFDATEEVPLTNGPIATCPLWSPWPVSLHRLLHI